MTQEQKDKAVRQHNETASYCPNQMRQVTCWEDLLPHQQVHYTQQTIRSLDN